MTNAVAHSRNSLIEIRRFYLGLSVLLAVLATIGFWPQYFGPLMSGTVETDTVIHVHVSVYVGWLVLFIFQCVLVAAGNIQLHRRVGNFGLAYGGVVVIVGVFTAVARFTTKLNDGGIEAVQHSALAPLSDMVLFSIFFGAAAYYRKKPELHKRLMIVAASSILIASVARFAGSFEFEPAIRHAVLLTLWLSPILLAMGFDFYRQRVVHPVYLIGVAAISLTSFRGPLRYTDTWVKFTHWLASVVS